MNLAQYRKFIVALIGLGATLVAQGLVAGSTARWVAIVVAAATSLGVYRAPNEPESDGGYTDAVGLLVILVVVIILLRILGAL